MRVPGAFALVLLLSLGCGSRTNPFIGLVGDGGSGGSMQSGGGGDSSSGGGTTGETGGLETGGRGGAEPAGGGGVPTTGGQPSTGGLDGTGGQVEPVAIRDVQTGGTHTCALLTNGAVRCWGYPSTGQLGYGHTLAIGDDAFETPAFAGDVSFGGRAMELSVNTWQTCVLLDTGNVRCWGESPGIGYPGLVALGDDETPDSMGDVDIGESVLHVRTGAQHTCAVLQGGRLRCWGEGDFGRLGYGNTEDIGDDETPASAGDVSVGGYVVDVTCGNGHTCALLDTGAIRCWGYGGGGALGYGNVEVIGDDEVPSDVGEVPVGAQVERLAAGNWHTCAIVVGGRVRCWGRGDTGALGYGNTQNVGDDEVPADVGDIDLGGAAVGLVGGKPTMCALLDTGTLRCWGSGEGGRLGYGNVEVIGDDETPASVGDVPLGDLVASATASSGTCALLYSGSVKCWGSNYNYTLGQPGLPFSVNIGDDETPDTLTPIQILDP